MNQEKSCHYICNAFTEKNGSVCEALSAGKNLPRFSKEQARFFPKFQLFHVIFIMI